MLKKYLPLIVFTFLVYLTVKSWFVGDMLLATAEEGLPFYNPTRSLELYLSIWTKPTFGIPVSFYMPRIPLFFVLSKLYELGVSPKNLQIFTFTGLIVSALYFFNKVLIEFNEKALAKEYGLLASVFYLFNFYTVSQIWYRFLMPSMFLWSLLPLFIFLWIRWIKFGKIKYLLFLVLSSLVFSYAFSFPSSLIVIWSVTFLYSLCYLLSEKKYGETSLRTIAGFAIWLIGNLWWLYPFWSLRNAAYDEMLVLDKSMTSLIEVSRFFPNSKLLTLQQNYMFREEGFLYTLYDPIKRNYVSWLVFGIALLGIIRSIKIKERLFVISLVVISWFICKGTNGPFGEIFYRFIFDNFTFMHVLRNPYEKYGVVLVFVYSILFALGVYTLTRAFPRLKLFIILGFLILLVGFIGRPLRNGLLFFDYRVQVPKYYLNVNNYVNQAPGRILVMPYLRGSNIDFEWGYVGDQPADYLFDKPTIAKTLSLTKIDRFYMLLSNYLGDPNFKNFISLTNTSHIIVHQDISLSVFHQENYQGSISYIKSWNLLSDPKNFDKIDVYVVNPALPVGDVYVIDDIQTIKTLNDLPERVLSKKFNPSKTGFYIEEQNSAIHEFSQDMKKPDIIVEKVSDRKYKIKVKNANQKYVLILTQNYSPLWKAYISDQQIENHFIINGYANAWLVDRPGEYEIDIIFEVWPWDIK